MSTTPDIKKGRDRGTRRRLVWTLHSHPAEMAEFLGFDSLPNGAGTSLIFSTKTVTCFGILFELWVLDGGTSFMCTYLSTAVMDRGMVFSSPTKFVNAPQTVRHLDSGFDFVVKMFSLADISSLSRKCDLHGTTTPVAWAGFFNKLWRALQVYMKKVRKDKRRTDTWHVTRNRLKRRKVDRADILSCWPMLTLIEKFILDALLADANFVLPVILTAGAAGEQTAQDMVPPDVIVQFGFGCCSVHVNTKQPCRKDPICGDLYICTVCRNAEGGPVALCKDHCREHDPSHVLEWHRRQHPAATLAEKPATTVQWSVIDVRGHKCDEQHPTNINKMKLLVNFAGPFLPEFHTLEELGFTRETSMVKEYFKRARLDVSSLARLVAPNARNQQQDADAGDADGNDGNAGKKKKNCVCVCVLFVVVVVFMLWLLVLACLCLCLAFWLLL